MPFGSSQRRWLSRSAITDECLADSLKQGDLGALSLLFERYHDSLYRFLYRWLGDTEEAEDLIQETFLRVYTSIQSYGSGRPFRPWIYTVAKHLAWKRLRERRGQAWVSMEDLPETGELLPDEEEGPESRFYRMSEGEAIRKAVEGLPEEQRLVFLLHHYESLSYEEIAEVCNCPLGTVKSRMHYALAHLRRRLAYLREER